MEVRLDFYAAAVGVYAPTLCEGASVTVNGTVYDASNPSGTELLEGASVNGCDSTVQIELAFQDPVAAAINRTLCPNESLTVNGTVYDIENPSGTETIEGAAANGCDSVVAIQLDFFPADHKIYRTLCPDEFITVNGTIYDQLNPMGTEVIEQGGAGGCDSIVEVQLKFYPEASSVFEQTLCAGESITVNGTVYDENNAVGKEFLFGEAANGCDSIIEVRLEFYPPATSRLEQVLCQGESFSYNGVVYDASNPSGIEVLPGASANGCDSIVQVQLSFWEEASSFFNQMICPGESVTVNGTVYDESKLTGEELIEGGAANGCDSIILVNLTIDPNCPEIGDFYIPSGITPNGDGRNDRFRIPALFQNPPAFNNNELIIRNDWGQDVYQASPYGNDWRGVNQNGQPLPAGTYFYSFRFGKGAVRQGEVTIIR